MNELKMRMAQIKFQNEQLLHERNSGKEFTKNQLSEYKMFIDGYNDQYSDDAYNNENDLR